MQAAWAGQLLWGGGGGLQIFPVRLHTKGRLTPCKYVNI